MTPFNFCIRNSDHVAIVKDKDALIIIRWKKKIKIDKSLENIPELEPFVSIGGGGSSSGLCMVSSV